MGLTINWNIEFTGTAKQLQTKLEKIRQKCLDLPFEEVGEKVKVVRITQKIIDTYHGLQNQFNYPNNTIENLAKRDRKMEKLGVTTWQMIEIESLINEVGKLRVQAKPTAMVPLYLWPGQGCESTELNFYKQGTKYVCKSSCKTQYAEHFVQCHLLTIQLLDMLKEEGFNVDVHDEGKYWETRDVKILAKNINESTAMIAGTLGSLQSKIKGKTEMMIETPITECQNYMKVE